MNTWTGEQRKEARVRKKRSNYSRRKQQNDSFKDNEFKEKQEEDHTDSNVSDSVVNISHWKMVTVTKFCLLVLEFFHFRVD